MNPCRRLPRRSAWRPVLRAALAQLPCLTMAASAMPEWPDTPLARLEAMALIETLQTDLLSGNSATLVLERWCREHALAEPPQIRARRIDSEQEPPSTATRTELQLRAGEAVHFRRVELACGDHVLSVAENWYVPDRLTAAMNRQLDTTQTPFGKVVQPLHPQRQTLSAQLLWAPLPPGWEMARATRADTDTAPMPERLAVPAALFEHRAVLYVAGHRAIAAVHEVYQRDLLAFPVPPP